MRRTVEVDFNPFIHPLVNLPRKSPERQEVLEGNSVVGELDQSAVLQVLDQQMSQKSELTEVEIFNRTLAIAHDKDVSAWAAAIAQWMGEHQVSMISLIQLQQAIEIPLIQLWLALLIGDQFVVEQRRSFYDLSGVWISIIRPVPEEYP